MTDSRSALIAVDVQRDFLPGGALGVTGGDAVVAPLLRAAAAATFSVATRDLHPAGHVSFVEQGGPWPDHCVAGTTGAEMDPRILDAVDLVVSKGRGVLRDAYEGFEVIVLEDAVRAVDVEAGDGERALDEMRAAGARVLSVADALSQPVG